MKLRLNRERASDLTNFTQDQKHKLNGKRKPRTVIGKTNTAGKVLGNSERTRRGLKALVFFFYRQVGVLSFL